MLQPCCPLQSEDDTQSSRSHINHLMLCTSASISRLSLILINPQLLSFFFFLNNPAPTEISPLPLHAPLPILLPRGQPRPAAPDAVMVIVAEVQRTAAPIVERADHFDRPGSRKVPYELRNAFGGARCVARKIGRAHV